MQQAQLGQSSNALLRNLNARGAGAGVQSLGASRVATEQYGNWLNRLQGLGGQGFQAAGAQAGVRGAQSDLNWGYGATKAGNDINFGNSLSASRNIGTNNLLNAAGTAAKAAAAFSDARLKRNVVRVGALPSGLPIYDFQYHFSEQIHRGVLAQEAGILFPGAIIRDGESGYLMVDYSKLS